MDNPVTMYKPQASTNTSGSSLTASDFILVLITTYQKTLLRNSGDDKIIINTTHGTTGHNFYFLLCLQLTIMVQAIVSLSVSVMEQIVLQ